MDTEPTITPYRDGPYLIRGEFKLVDQDGNEIEVRRKTIALCRFGRSRTRPALRRHPHRHRLPLLERRLQPTGRGAHGADERSRS